MGNFDSLIGKFIIVGCFLLAMFSFIVVSQSDNGTPDPIENNSIFGGTLTALNTQAQTSSSIATNGSNSFFSESPQAGFGSIILLSIVSVGKTFSSIVFGFFSVAIKLPLMVLGIPASIYNLVITWLIITVIVALWLLYKLGG